jgi:tRNA threonylcarbamoyladenosine biosynthesis protein TsaB
MRVLALDCTAKSVSAAIAEDGKLICESFLNINLTHSQTLLVLCEQLLSNTKLKINEIDAFGITAGPGSFTGVRIGISAIKGMAFAQNTPVFPFSTTEAMALNFKNMPILNGIICGVMDARCNQFYNGIFEIKNGEIYRLTEDRIIMADALLNELEEKYNGQDIILVGDGAKLFFKECQNHPNITLSPEHLLVQRAAGIAIKASLSPIQTAINPNVLQPIYLRKSQAERERETKSKE